MTKSIGDIPVALTHLVDTWTAHEALSYRIRSTQLVNNYFRQHGDMKEARKKHVEINRSIEEYGGHSRRMKKKARQNIEDVFTFRIINYLFRWPLPRRTSVQAAHMSGPWASHFVWWRGSNEGADSGILSFCTWREAVATWRKRILSLSPRNWKPCMDLERE